MEEKMISNLSRALSWKSASVPKVLLVILAIILGACAGSTSSPTAAVPATAEASQVPTQEATMAPTQPAATPTEAMAVTTGVLRVAMQPLVQTDPAFISSDAEVLVANAVYDYLVDVTPQNTIEPRLATKWDISQDGLTYVFTLADGVTFHDGSPLSANDVVWTFNRLRDPQNDTPTKDLYSNIVDIKATGDLEVTFTLKEPNPFFLFDLSDNHALVMKADTQDPGNFNGTGPFSVTTYSPEDRIVLSANPNYFIKGEPKLSGFEIIFFNDESAQVDALRGGQVDLVMRLSTDLYISLKGESGFTLFEVSTNQFDLVRLRADEKPGNDPRVIQALKLATDREAIFQLVLQGYGRIGRDSPIGPMYTQYYSEDTPLPKRDVAAAKQLLADAGYPDGLSLDMHVPDTGVRPNLALALKDQWAEAGVNINVIVEPESVYYGDNGWLAVDLGITGWGSRPYPQFYLDTMLTCNAVWNEAHWCDAEFDQLAKVAGTTMDEQTRVNAYKEIQRILIERGPVIIPYFTTQLGAINNQFQDFQMKPFPGRSDFREVTFNGS
jgi:peptide/nickel transport system substrate-binding protein